MARATLFEEHASVLPHWVAQGLRDATIVCLDAHLDLQFIAPERIARLRACASAGELAQLESAHPLSPLRDACYGIEDFLYAAVQLGCCGGWCGSRRRTCWPAWTWRCTRCARWRASPGARSTPSAAPPAAGSKAA
ncbi:hypothetical protein [Ramlibacter montanisoli]|uniref:Uncharacterized protein n=1 Tax=Ramlibacter montanisoli TaxID=2732512 RepID=A0A849K6G8_9BURK|nr:hypothetical protein [Ramlibacter montanisoli]NNU43160.1 hypothetical protein [Ramlibacter montanisoli]